MKLYRLDRTYHHARRAGFSLVEVLVAMFIIVVGIAGVTSTLYWGVQKSDAGKEVSEASNLARICMETLIVRGSFVAGTNVNDAPAARTLLDAPPLAATDFTTVGKTEAGAYHNVASTVNSRRFRRNISFTRLNNTTTAYDYPLCRATVRIYWEDKKGVERFVTHETITPWTSPPLQGAVTP